MKKEWIFLGLSRAYAMLAHSGFVYVKHANILVKPFALVAALVYGAIFKLISMIFHLLVIFDWIGGLTDALRKKLLNIVEHISLGIDNSLFSFLINPIALVIVVPMFLLSLFIPKFSSNVALNMAVDELTGILDGSGIFFRIKEIVWSSANRLFAYVSKTFLILKPFVAVVAIGYSIVLMIIGMLFFILIPLDWLSQIIENSRQMIVNFVYNRQYSIQNSLGGFLITPVFLIVLAPLFLAVVLVPKFLSTIESDS